MTAVNATSSQQPTPQTPEVRSPEPSMEDILASIRRIIADDQSRSNGAAGLSVRRPGTMPPYAPLAPEIRPIGEEASPSHLPVPDVYVRAPRPESEPLPQPHLNPPVSAEDADDAHGSAVIEAIAHAGVAAILQPRATGETRGGQTAGASAPIQAVAVEEPVEEDETPNWRVEAEAEPLISPQAGDSVGSSFQALATTVLMQNTDIIEQMMRDMLRPMLKTWLDDNLPTIVERLVRAEIERVARGGRA